MGAPKEILELIARFEENREAYRAGQYHETQLRREFLDPCFKALGWDVDNCGGYAEAYKDVIHEDQIRVGGILKAPDYCFRIGGTRKFFLEAKKPSVQIKDEPAPAFQLRRYAWSAKLALSILSDFEEFAIYDGRVKPFKNDSASTARIFYCTFRELAEKWEWLASVFSRDAVLRGAFDKYAESTRAKRGTTEVDADFLVSMENWRADLARNLALRNPKLIQRELNFAVQRILDRIIFLRICEDRGIEDYGRLRSLLNGERVYPRLCQLFQQADTRYNSGLFHFQPEKGRNEPPDNLTLELELDDKLLHELLRGLYYPDSPYEFSVITGDILGHVYEQFLGKVIRLTEGHRAVVEEKPEVRKAGGVYYTPTYIVDYIVRETVGRLLIGIAGESVPRIILVPGADVARSPAEPERPADPPTPKAVPLDSRRVSAILERVAQLRILDPACGSGSFLIGAYQQLLDWHLDFYLANDPQKWAKGRKPTMVQTQKGWRLTIAERKRILLNNIFGVDIDPQAVEVTKLSLLLKVLEGETQQSVQSLLGFLHERALPDLGHNVKCGNSLIGPDFYDQPQLALLTEDDRLRINVFDWPTEFPHILRRKSATGKLQETPATPLDYTWPGVPLHGDYASKPVKTATKPTAPTSRLADWEGGFDAVIGNPPYVRIQIMKASQPEEAVFLSRAYGVASRGNYDIYVVFVERGLDLLNRNGRLGFILPHKFFSAEYGRPLRTLLASGKHLEQLVHFGHCQVFASATTYTCLLFGGKSPAPECTFLQVRSLEGWSKQGDAQCHSLPAEELGGDPWNFHAGPVAQVMKRIGMGRRKLADVAHLFVGLQTDADDVFILQATGEESKGRLRCASVAGGSEYWFEADHLKPFLKGSLDVRRYGLSGAPKYLIFPYRNVANRSVLISADEYEKQHPLTWQYLQANKARLGERAKGKLGTAWYGYVYKKNHLRFDQPKILAPAIARGACFAWDAQGSYYFVGSGGGGGGGYGIVLNPEAGWSPLFLLGLLNSKLTTFFLRLTSSVFRGGYIALNRQYIERVPLPELQISHSADRLAHDRVVVLVDQMLVFHRQLAATRTPFEKTALERQIAATDQQIDRLVYELYGLTAEEIRIVEEAGQ